MKNMKINKKLLIALILVALGGVLVLGIQHKVGQERQAELKRNREYEVSLVNALKNSYKDIKEIKISDPEYTEKPGNWHCRITIIFIEEKEITFGTSYDLESQKFSTGGVKRKKKGEWEYLQSKFGVTQSKIKIKYSDGREVVK